MSLHVIYSKTTCVKSVVGNMNSNNGSHEMSSWGLLGCRGKIMALGKSRDVWLIQMFGGEVHNPRAAIGLWMTLLRQKVVKLLLVSFFFLGGKIFVWSSSLYTSRAAILWGPRGPAVISERCQSPDSSVCCSSTALELKEIVVLLSVQCSNHVGTGGHTVRCRHVKSHFV